MNKFDIIDDSGSVGHGREFKIVPHTRTKNEPGMEWVQNDVSFLMIYTNFELSQKDVARLLEIKGVGNVHRANKYRASIHIGEFFTLDGVMTEIVRTLEQITRDHAGTPTSSDPKLDVDDIRHAWHQLRGMGEIIAYEPVPVDANLLTVQDLRREEAGQSQRQAETIAQPFYGHGGIGGGR